MSDENRDQPNSKEGADPSDDIKKQNPGQRTAADIADERASNDDPDKTQKLTKAGRHIDPNAGSE